jgi:hypothetical protein
MATFEERTELELQGLKFGAPSKLWVACLGSSAAWPGRRHRSLLGCSHSLALRSSAELVCWAVKAPASLAPPPVKHLASTCARYERREVKGSTVSATKSWQRTGRSNTMLQRAQSPERSWRKA